MKICISNIQKFILKYLASSKFVISQQIDKKMFLDKNLIKTKNYFTAKKILKLIFNTETHNIYFIIL